MTKPIPDTDPLKREPPGAVSKVPHEEVDRSEQSAGKPDEQGGAATGGRPGRQEAEGQKATQFDGNPNPEGAPSSPLGPKDDTPTILGKESRNDQ